MTNSYTKCALQFNHPPMVIKQIFVIIKKRISSTLVTKLNLLEVYPFIIKAYGKVDTKLSLLLTQILPIRSLATTENETLFGSTPPFNNLAFTNIGKAFFPSLT